MNIYILTEITKRELDSNLFLACNAANHGFDVIISNHGTFKLLNDKKLLKEGIFHTKSLVHGKKKKKLHESLKKNNIKISSIDEEAGLILKDLTIFSKARFTEDDFKDADKVFCWGNDDFKTLNNLFNNSKGKLFLSGSPRFDMMRKEFDSYWNFSEQHAKHITISGNFNLVNGYIHRSKIISELEKQGYFYRSENYKNFLIETIDDTEKKFNEFMKMVEIIIQKFPNEQFLLRPHPLEKIETWENKFAKKENIKISKEGNINEQLINSKILIHNSCTTAFHAYFYNIPTISYEPIHCKSDYGQRANELSERVKNTQELCELITSIINNEYEISNKDIKNNLFNYKVYRPNKMYSAEKIVREWKEIAKSSRNNLLDVKKIKFELLKDSIINKFKRILLKIAKPLKNLYLDKKFDVLDEIEISKKIDKITKILNIKSKIEVQKISDRCFFIRKKD